MSSLFKTAAAATVQRLQLASTSTTFLADRLLILGHGVQEPAASQAAFLESLAVAAHSAANSVLCSSIVAGHTSESDDFADVSVYLGNGSFGIGNEQSVLKALGLDAGGRISPVPISEKSKIPSTVRAQNTTPELADLSAKLAELQDLHCFSVRPASGSDVIFTLLGKNAHGWAGIVGIGVWSDD